MTDISPDDLRTVREYLQQIVKFSPNPMERTSAWVSLTRLPGPNSFPDPDAAAAQGGTSDKEKYIAILEDDLENYGGWKGQQRLKEHKDLRARLGLAPIGENDAADRT